MEIKGSIQKYEWGKIGSASKVAQLEKMRDPLFEIVELTPYAELWMGTHPKGPSRLKDNNKLLSDWIREHGCDSDAGQLPFLFKVLSVNQALSIQAHPDKELARKLHADSPHLYSDPNHKPELAVALTNFTAMCGFRPYNEINTFLSDIPQLANLIGCDLVDQFKKTKSTNSLKKVFESLMTASITRVVDTLQEIQAAFEKIDDFNRVRLNVDLFNNLSMQFPGDVGVLCIYFLNVLHLQPGEGIFLGPNIPHAYISGDCVECMACSDNVVRAGLTPKFKDVLTLINMLDYEGRPPKDQMFKPTETDSVTQLFNPPVPDFAVAKYNIPSVATFDKYTIKQDTHSIILVISGSADSSSGVIHAGTILFVPSQEEFTVLNIHSDELVMFQAMSMV